MPDRRCSASCFDGIFYLRPSLVLSRCLFRQCGTPAVRCCALSSMRFFNPTLWGGGGNKRYEYLITVRSSVSTASNEVNIWQTSRQEAPVRHVSTREGEE